jgi:cold shock CspA family protein
MQRGTVTEFDEQRGLGTVVAGDGTPHLFHCTQIVGGTRTIAVGTAVTFTVWPRLGRYEAAEVTPVLSP